jgi:rubrerythrin
MERLSYMGIFECPQCKETMRVPRRYTYRRGPEARCPLCGTYRLRLLAERDHIDRMYTGIMNVLQRITGGRIYHCRYCRVQFYDRRRLAPESVTKATRAG